MKSANAIRFSAGAVGVNCEIEDADGVHQWVLAYPELKRPLKKILLDPGHSNKVPGARSNNQEAEEEDLNLYQAELIAEALMGKAKVDIYDPPEDNLREIGSMAAGYDIFISLHHNSYDGYADPGTEVFFAPGAKAASKSLAETLSASISNALGSINRGAKEMNFTVIRTAEILTAGPCVLVESYFITKYSRTEAKQRTKIAAKAIADVLSSLCFSLR